MEVSVERQRRPQRRKRRRKDLLGSYGASMPIEDGEGGCPPSSGNAVVVRQEGALPTTPRKRLVIQQRLKNEATGTPLPYNSFCFNCHGCHWRSDPCCPANSDNPTIRRLGAQRRLDFTARYTSVCGGCKLPTVAGVDSIVAMNGFGVDGTTQWWHKACQHGKLAVVQSHDADKQEHTITHEIDNVLRWVKATDHGSARHAIVMAGPGTGKTQLVVRVNEAVVNMQPRAPRAPLVLAFNKEAVTELQDRSVVGAQTFHSYGLRLWRDLHPNVKVCSSKIRGLLKAEYPPDDGQPKRQKYRRDVIPLLNHILKLVSLAKADVLDPESRDFQMKLDGLIAEHGVTKRLQYELKDKAVAAPLQQIRRIVAWVLRESIQTAQQQIDFNDMIYMPVLTGAVHEPGSGWVIVDYCPDLYRALSQLAERLTGDRGHLLIVGDEHQALYGYTGASAKVLRELRAKMGITTEFPLTCSWRLPRRHVQNAVALMHKYGHGEYTLEYSETAAGGMIARERCMRAAAAAAVQ